MHNLPVVRASSSDFLTEVQREFSTRLRPHRVLRGGGARYSCSSSADLTLMNSLSHLWCLPDLVERPPRKRWFNTWGSESRSCSIHRQLGSFWLLEPPT